MQFGRALSYILQAIWESDPYKIPVQVPNMDVVDTYYRGMLRLSQVGVFTYVIPLTADGDCIIIYMYMVLPM